MMDSVKIQAAAECLAVSPWTLGICDRRGKIRVCRHPIDRYRLFRKADLEALVKRLEWSAGASRRRG